MLASLYYIFGNTEKYDNLTGSVIGIIIFLIGLIATFTLYSIYLVDTSLDNKPAQKSERLRVIIVGGFTISLLISVYVAFSINRYNFCMENKDVCIADYAFSPFA
jgi:hypothetical protein